MRWRWLVGDYTHPGAPLTRADRRRAGKLVNEKYLPRWEVVKVSLMLAAPAVGACVVLPWVLGYMGLGGRNGPYIAGLAVICMAVWLASSWAFASVMARPFRRAMRDLGHNVCIGCGYSRDGLEARTRCPECGEAPEG